MPNVLRSAGVVLVAALLAGACADSTPTDTQRECEIHHTAQVAFENRSTARTYDVIWDGVRIVPNLVVGAKSEYRTENAGPHLLTFKYAGTSRVACTTSYPNLVECSSHTFWCTH